jgi:AsmA family protein
MDWNWLRGPAQRLASSILQREISLGHLEVRPGLTSVVRLRDVRVANTDWSQVQPMATVREIEFSIRLGSMLMPPRVLPHVRLTDADVLLERLADGRANWEFGRGGRQGEDTATARPRLTCAVCASTVGAWRIATSN